MDRDHRYRSRAARSPTRTFWEVGALSNIRLLAVGLGLIPVTLLEVGKLLARVRVAPEANLA